MRQNNLVSYSIKKTPKVSDMDPKVNSMKKHIFILLAFFSLFAQARADWNPYVMDYERFVHLSDDEKRTVVIKTMEVMVELESKYKKDVQTSGYSTDRYEKYVKAFNTLQNFLIASAQAAPDKSLRGLATSFGDLLKRLGTKGCVYGGYVSMIDKTGSYCQHPTMVKQGGADAQKIRDAYLGMSGGSPCVGPKKISCNPVVFGYSTTKESDNKPFCVETNYLKTGVPHNVSYECMKKALAGDDVEARLKVVSDAMTGNEKAFNDVHKFIFKTCACGESTNINADYAGYIKPHRTCFGMMNTLREMKHNECAVLEATDPTSFPNEWSQYFSKQGGPELAEKMKTIKSSEWDQAYSAMIDHNSVKDICANMDADQKEEWSCKAKCEQTGQDQGGAKVWTCKFDAVLKITKGTQVKEERSEIADMKFADDTHKSANVKSSDGKDRDCSLEFIGKQPTEEKSCSISLAHDEADKTKATATVSIKGYKETDKFEVTWTGAVKDATNQMIAAVTKSNEKGEVSASYKLIGAGAVTTVGTKVGAAVGAAAGAVASAQSCKVEVPAIEAGPDEGKDYTIEAKAEEPKDPKQATIKVVATVKKKGEVLTALTGLVIKWTREGFKGTEIPKEKPKERKGLAGDGDGRPKKEETATTTEGGEAIQPAADNTKDDGPTKDEPRTKEVYKACATLYDAKGTKLAGPSCDDISPLAEEKPQNQPPVLPPNSQPAMPSIMPLNTGARGVL